MGGKWGKGFISGAESEEGLYFPDWFYLPGFPFLVPAHPGGPGQNLRGQ